MTLLPNYLCPGIECFHVFSAFPAHQADPQTSWPFFQCWSRNFPEQKEKGWPKTILRFEPTWRVIDTWLGSKNKDSHLKLTHSVIYIQKLVPKRKRLPLWWFQPWTHCGKVHWLAQQSLFRHSVRPHNGF